MSESLGAVFETDATLDLLAARSVTASEDAVLDGLARLACAVDRDPLPEALPLSIRQVPQGRRCGWALSVSVAMVLASSGVAAAVSDDPLAPYHYVKDQVTRLATPRETSTGWDLLGARAVATTPHGSTGVERVLIQAPDEPRPPTVAGTTSVGHGTVRAPAKPQGTQRDSYPPADGAHDSGAGAPSQPAGGRQAPRDSASPKPTPGSPSYPRSPRLASWPSYPRSPRLASRPSYPRSPRLASRPSLPVSPVAPPPSGSASGGQPIAVTGGREGKTWTEPLDVWALLPTSRIMRQWVPTPSKSRKSSLSSG